MKTDNPKTKKKGIDSMPDYIIATSSTSDLPRSWLDEHQIPFIAYTYTIGTEIYEDDCREESRSKIYEAMRGGALLKTSMNSTEKYCNFFRELLDTGKDVIFLDMSREMSVSYANANAAAEKVLREYPGRKFYLMDTLCISGGLGLLVERMVELMEAGESYDAVIAWGEANKLKIAHRFTVDDLKYLQASGRVSNAAALVGSLFSIKPVLYVPDEGSLKAVKKVHGRKSALKAIINSTINDLKQTNSPTGHRIHILQADCAEDAEKVRDAVRAEFPQAEITITGLGVVIGAHCGPGLLTVFYLCNGRVPE